MPNDPTNPITLDAAAAAPKEERLEEHLVASFGHTNLRAARKVFGCFAPPTNQTGKRPSP